MTIDPPVPRPAETARRASPAPVRSRWLAWLQLIRLPNVFTPVADVTMAFLCTHPSLWPLDRSVPLLIASATIYTGGLVLNDYFDYAADLVERPQRPLPSGRIARSTAGWLGAALLAAGLAAALLATVVSGLVAAVLVGLVLLYDGVVKRSPRWRDLLGPPGMAACRFTNVVLGLTAAGSFPQAAAWLPAVLVGLYILGVTWLSLHEAAGTRRGGLAGAAVVLHLVFALLLVRVWGAIHRGAGVGVAVVFVAGVEWALARAVLDPSPQRLQAAVKTGVLSLILLDAAIVAGLRGPLPALGIAALLLPALGLGRWIYST